MPKPYLNTTKVDDVIRKAKRMVPLPRDAYVGNVTPQGKMYIDHVLKTYNMSGTNRMRLEAMNHEYFHGITHAYNNKIRENQKMLELITKWTHSAHNDIQHSRRKNNRNVKNKSRHVNYAISKYFRETNIRAPYKNTRFKKVKYLYRAVDLQDIPRSNRMLSSGIFRDKGMMAFSRNFSFVQQWGSGWDDPVIFRLNLQDVPKGVPWLWFSNDIIQNVFPKLNTTSQTSLKSKGIQPTMGFAPYIPPYMPLLTNANSNNKYTNSQSEVLLPPGYLVLKHTEAKKLHRTSNNITMYDVSYIPDLTAKSLLKNTPMHSDVTFNKNVRNAHNRIARQFALYVNRGASKRKNRNNENISKRLKK